MSFRSVMMQGSLSRRAASGANPVGTHEFVRSLGVPDLGRHTSPFDPGYDVVTVVSHLEQSGHLMSRLKISMACWLIASETATLDKVAAAGRLGVPLVTGGGPFEIAQDRGKLDEFLELVASLGIDRIEAGEGFTALRHRPVDVVRKAERVGLKVQVELGEKHSGAFTATAVRDVIDSGLRWLDAGAVQVVIEARENAARVGLFDEGGRLDFGAADALVDALGMDRIIFEAPTKRSQFDFLQHFGSAVNLGNVRLEELLRVEIYRRGLHSDAYGRELAGRPVTDSK
jgi:phosphosulfolactate synthase